VGITPLDLAAGNITSYTVNYSGRSVLGAGGTITIDWTGDGVSEGVIQQLLPATVTINDANCIGSVTVQNGNTVIAVMNAGASVTCSLSGNVQLVVTNVRNPKAGANRAGAVKTSADADSLVSTTDYITWQPGGMNSTAAGSLGVGPNVTSLAAVGGSIDINIYVTGVDPVVLSTTRGIFAASGVPSITCWDGRECDADHLFNGIITVVLQGNGDPGPATVTTSSIASGAPQTIALTFIGPPTAITVAANPPAIPNDGQTPSTVTATATDIGGNPVPDGTLVSFSTLSGTLSSATSATVNGVASVSLTATGGASVTVTAAAGGVTASATVAITPFHATVTATSTGTYCFRYGGPPLLPANFALSFAPQVASVNVLQLPAGNYLSWFRAAPGLATATGLAPGQTVCVSAPPGTTVFAGS